MGRFGRSGYAFHMLQRGIQTLNLLHCSYLDVSGTVSLKCDTVFDNVTVASYDRLCAALYMVNVPLSLRLDCRGLCLELFL